MAIAILLAEIYGAGYLITAIIIWISGRKENRTEGSVRSLAGQSYKPTTYGQVIGYAILWPLIAFSLVCIGIHDVLNRPV